MTPILNEQEYQRAMTEIERLMEADPAAGTPECEELSRLAEVVAEYERIHYPIVGVDDDPPAARPTVEEWIDRWLEQPGTFVTDGEQEFIFDMRKCALAGVGYGWMTQIIEIEWNNKHGHAFGPRYFQERIDRLERATGYANQHRLAVIRARLRCSLLEQAVKWCRGRVEVLEDENAGLREQLARTQHWLDEFQGKVAAMEIDALEKRTSE